jgi:hypothetical protein
MTVGGAAQDFYMFYETAPSKDDSLFVPIAQQLLSATDSPNPHVYVTKILLSAGNLSVGKWLRWRIAPKTAPMLTWDVTFRLFVAANYKRAVRYANACGCPTP